LTFATAEDLRVELGLTTLTADQELRAERRLDAATGAIQRYCRQTISRVTDDVAILTGTWAAGLVLPELPVVSISTVVVDTETLEVICADFGDAGRRRAITLRQQCIRHFLDRDVVTHDVSVRQYTIPPWADKQDHFTTGDDE
jgi:hypothetical protein